MCLSGQPGGGISVKIFIEDILNRYRWFPLSKNRLVVSIHTF